MVSLSKLAEIAGAEIKGDAAFEVTAIAVSPDLAKDSELALVFDNKKSKAKKALESCAAKAVLVSEEIKNHPELLDDQVNYLFVKRPRFALQQIIDLFAPKRHKPSTVHPSSVIDETADIDPSVTIGPFVNIGPNTRIKAGTVLHARVSVGADVTVGENCEIYSGVVVEDHSVLGDRVVIHANSVIGSDGFSYVTKDPSNLEKLKSGDFNLSFDRQIQEKISSAGNVEIADDVEIGSNVSIDRGTIGPTRIGAGTKVDNLCQIAHNVQVGKDCLIIANVGIAGSAKIGDRVTMAGGSACADKVELGHDVVVAAYSPVNSDVGPLKPVIGLPAIDYAEFMKRQKALVRLPKYQEQLKFLRSKVQELESKLHNGK